MHWRSGKPHIYPLRSLTQTHTHWAEKKKSSCDRLWREDNEMMDGEGEKETGEETSARKAKAKNFPLSNQSTPQFHTKLPTVPEYNFSDFHGV